ncbi:uncharacterized protein LOC109529755, partial [Hippocampus comes]|uniref:uncharacterized protein LOC109529755 n=1 Tax=Hippocampus comes TaxID=109280 RepID=UPI00094ECE04
LYLVQVFPTRTTRKFRRSTKRIYSACVLRCLNTEEWKLSQTEQEKGFSPAWTTACSFKSTFLVKRLPQRPQAKGFAPACARTCRSHDDCAPKPTSQAAQAKGFSLVRVRARAAGFIWREKPRPRAEQPAWLGASCAGPERERKVARHAEQRSASAPTRSPTCPTAASRSSHDPRLKAAASGAPGDRRPSSSLTMTRPSSSRLTSTCRSSSGSSSSSFTRAISASSSSSLTRRGAQV